MREINLKDHTLAWMGRSDQFRSASRGTFWPSEASAVTEDGNVIGKCMRSIYYRLTGAPVTNPPTAKNQVIFLLGKEVEEAVVEIWKQSGIWNNNSVRFEDRSINLSGEFDCVLFNPVTGGKYGVEVKSFWGYFQEKTILGGYEGRGSTKRWVFGKPKDENLMQAAIYADQTRGQLEGFKLFYISRDNCEMAEFNITVDDNGTIFVADPKKNTNEAETRFTIHDVYNRYKDLANKVQNSEIPDRDFTWKPSDEMVEQLHSEGKISNTKYKDHTEGKEKYTDWHCDYCSYRDHCWTRTGEARDAAS